MRPSLSLALPLILFAASARAQNPPAATTAVDLAGQPAPHSAPAPEDVPLSPSGDNLFEFLAGRQGRVPFTGLRTYVQWVENAAVMRCRERVLVAQVGGAYRFSLELLQVEGLSADALVVSRKLFENHAGFLHAYRDFRVHDAETARANYTVTPLGSFLRVGHAMRVFDVRPRVRGLSSYRILVGEEGVVLDQAEFDPNGRVLSAVVYEAVQYGDPQLTAQTVLWQPWMESTAHTTLADATRLLDFVPAVPKAAGQGFELAQLRTTKHPGDGKTYLVLVYTDGIDARFVVESKAGASLTVIVSPELNPVPVERFRIGPATQYRVQYDGREILVLGQFYEDGVPALLRALLNSRV